MKKGILLIIIVICCNNLFSQDNYQVFFSKLFGGNGLEFIRSIVTDSQGNIYLTGATRSNDFPISSDAIQKQLAGGYDIFIMKLSPDGEVIYSSYIGDSGNNAAYELILDNNENIWIVGETSSNFLSATKDAFQKTNTGGFADGFILKLDENFKIVYFSYCGGVEYEAITSLAVDEENNIWFVGQTLSQFLPVTKNAVQKSNMGGWDCFIGKINQNYSLELLTFHGATGNDKAAEGIDINSKGNPVIVGWTDSFDFILKNPFQSTLGGRADVYIAELNKVTGATINNSFLGGNNNDRSYNIEIDNNDNIFITGFTKSSNFPLKKDVINLKNKGNGDIFISQISPDWKLVWSTIVGGSDEDGMYGLDSYQGGISLFEDQIAFTSKVWSNDFSVTDDAFQPQSGGGAEAIICLVEKQGGIIYSSYLGGSGTDRGFNVYFDIDGNLLVCGETESSNFPIFNSSNIHNGNMDGFLTKFNFVSPSGPCSGTKFDFPSFGVSEMITLSNDAFIEDDFVRLTNNEMFRKGGLWFEPGAHAWAGFETSFSFRFSEGNNYGFLDGSLPGADGLAFVIQANPEIQSGGYGGNIGFAGIENSFAVEIDTYKNFAVGFEDPDGNHIAVFANGEDPNNANHKGDAWIAETSNIPVIEDSVIYNCKIKYRSNKLSIYLNRADEEEKLVLEIDNFILSDEINFEKQNIPFVGIVSSTGNSTEIHDILSWSYCGAFTDNLISVYQGDNTDKMFNLYPNPISTYIMIDVTKSINYIKITNILGKTVYQSSELISNNIKINTEDFESGLYFIELRDNYGESYHQNFLKQ